MANSKLLVRVWMTHQPPCIYFIHMHCTVCKERPVLPRADGVSNQAHGLMSPSVPLIDTLKLSSIGISVDTQTILDWHLGQSRLVNTQLTIDSFFIAPVTEIQVLTLFAGLKENKACLDVPNKLIKLASGPLSVPFTKIYNESIAIGVVPEIFKISRVTPIFKSGTVTELGNYRPIAVISPFSKILERLVYNQLMSFLEKQCLLFDFQFGFRKEYSTEHAILETLENFKTAKDDNKITCGIFLDFSKAFDMINHHILLEKLKKYGIRGLPHAWFASYITNRRQYVKIGNTESSLKTVTCGVPQGSTLGPLLHVFLLYINDLPRSSKKLIFKIFADDTNIYYSSNNLEQLQTVINEELELHVVLKYCAANKLSINLRRPILWY